MKNDIQSIAAGRRPVPSIRKAVAVACCLAVALLMLSVAPDAWSQGLPVKTCPNGITAYLCKDDIIVSDGNSDGGLGRIILVDPVNGNQTSIAHGLPYLTEPVCVVFDPNDGNLLVVAGFTGVGQLNGVVRVNPGTGAQTLLSSGFSAPFAIALDNNGNIFIADSGYSATDPNSPLINVGGRIVKVDRVTGAQTVWAQGGYISHPYGITFDAGNTRQLYVTDAFSFNGQGAVYSLDPANINSPPRLIWGPSTAVPAPVIAKAPPMGCPLGITVESNGNILARTFSYPPPPNVVYGCVPAGIFRLDLSDNTQHTITDNATTPPLSWSIPFGMDTEDNGNLLVSDEGLRMVFRLNPNIPYNPANPIGNFVSPIPLSRDGFFVQPVNLTRRKSQPTVNIALPPTATINPPANMQEGSPLNLTATVTGDLPTYAWTVKKNGTTVASGTAASLTFTPDDSVAYDVGLLVTTGAGTGAATATIVPANVPPTVGLDIPPNSFEGTPVTLNSIVSDPSPADTAIGFTYSWTVTKNGTTVASGTAASLTFTPDDNGPYVVSLSAKDKDNGTGVASTTINVNNVAPIVTGLPALVSLGTSGTVAASFTANFTDAGTKDTHTCSISWGDGYSGPGVVTETNGSGSCVGTHDITHVGVFTIVATVTDNAGASATDSDYLVVYDPTAGFVSGSGSITSPAGAYIADPLKTGPATFAFNMRYKLGVNIPSGPTSFNFTMASLSFTGVSYDWLVVAGDKAQFKGKGTIGNTGNYGFIVTARDGEQNGATGIDKFRIKIWAINPDGSEGNLVYDNVKNAPDDIDSANPQPINSGNVLVFLDTAPTEVTSTIDPISVPENEQYSVLTGSFTDPDVGESHTVTVDWSDGTAVSTISLNAGFFTFSAGHAYLQNNAPGTPYSIKVTVGDSYGKSGIGTTPVTVTNVRPLLSGGTWPTTPVAIGALVTVKVNFTDVGLKDTHTCMISLGDYPPEPGTPTVGVVTETTANPPASFMSGYCTGTHSYSAGGDHPLSITLADTDGGSDTSTDIVINVNGPVTIATLGAAPSTIDENTATTLTGTLQDDESSIHVVTINWGDGTANTTLNLSLAIVEFSTSHTYKDDKAGAAPDVYTISVTVADDGGSNATSSTTVTVNNSSPVVSSITPGTANPNVSATFTANFTDAGILDTHTCQFSWGDGSAGGPGTVSETIGTGIGSCSAPHTYSAVGSYTVTVTVTDDDGGPATGTKTVVVSNVNTPPNITNVLVNNVATTNTVILGNGATVKVNFTDTGIKDTHTCLIEWGDSSTDSPISSEANGSGSCTTPSHTYAASGTYSGKATVTDDDGGPKIANFTVKVTTAPVISSLSLSANPINENATVTFSGSFTDPDAGETHKVVIAWADGTANTTINLAAGVFTFSTTHKFSDDNPTATATDVYNINVTVTDGNNASGTSSTSITVKNVAPVITSNDATLSPPIWIDFTDVGTKDTHIALINWGDGTTTEGAVNEGNGVGFFTGDHHYTTPGPHTIVVTVTDDDGASVSKSFPAP